MSTDSAGKPTSATLPIALTGWRSSDVQHHSWLDRRCRCSPRLPRDHSSRSWPGSPFDPGHPGSRPTPAACTARP
eukprot:1256686-Prymnesium_polylepis.1